MLFEMQDNVLTFEKGQTVSDEDLKAHGCDIGWLMDKGAIKQLGFIEADKRATLDDVSASIAELQKKYEALERQKEQLVKEVKEKAARIRFLEEAHKQGAKQLRESVTTIATLEHDLRAARIALATHESPAQLPAFAPTQNG